MKTCPKCKEEFDSRKKFCSDSCKYWYNLIKKENDTNPFPVKKRTGNYFEMVSGFARIKSISTQGKRSGGMVMGSMGVLQYGFTYSIELLTEENVIRHFKGSNNQFPEYIRLGNGIRIYKKEIRKKLGFNPTPRQ